MRNPKDEKPVGSGKRRKSGKASDKLSFGDYRIVKFSATDEQKQDFMALLESGEFSIDDMYTLLGEGNAVKFSPPDGDGTYLVSITCTNVSSENAGLVVTSFAGDPITALAFGVYKVRYLAEDDQWATLENHGSDTGPRLG